MTYSENYPIPVVTENDVFVIERYARSGKAIPTTEAGVQAKYKDAKPEWLKDITANFCIINTHANSWESVQSNMIEVAALLVGFAKDLREYGDEAVNIIKAMDGYKTHKIADLTPDQLDQFPSISLDNGDQENIRGLDKTVGYIKNSIAEKRGRSVTILNELRTFQRTISETIKPWVGSMITSSNPDKLDEEISDLTTRLLKLKDDKTAAAGLKKYSQDDTTHKPHMLYEWAHGKKSISDDPTVRALAKQIEDSIALLSQDKKFKGFLQILHTSMISLYDVVTPAITAVIQLQSHWTATEKLVSHSSDQFTSYKLLGQFVNRMEEMLGDWRTVEQNSSALQEAFRIQ
ncbi:hypothetical protein DJ564_30350 [Pseudomonas sp. 31-12]|uniref:hypothetical protein n=1 Tax=Pseudomonas sp. 31-12 TaxID=2201356 RepID=UPI000D6D5C79|nr:hypothetical protein [Pseudomonas sp. 31-12]AWM94779.1 hypothetical protein DJ564_30350 [Pseudomonas sp. 31-12]